MTLDQLSLIPLDRASLCVACSTISNAPGARCPGCGCEGGLLSLARVLNPSPELGSITFVLSPPSPGSVTRLDQANRTLSSWDGPSGPSGECRMLGETPVVGPGDRPIEEAL